MGGIKNSIDIELKVFNPSPHVLFPFALFMINDSNKVIPIIAQNMCNEICHSVFQTYNYDNITKKRKDVITYHH
jgi:hypothetical protein